MKSIKIMDKYIIQSQLNFEVEAEDEKKAKELASEKFKIIEGSLKDSAVSISDSKVVHKKSGYFV